jgi:ribonuclease-3
MQNLGVVFRDPALLRLALVHSSWLNEQAEHPEHERFEQSNERLEFLGDAVLGFLTAEYLYRAFPGQAEGSLTVLRAGFVRTETLAQWAREFELDQLLYLAQGEDGVRGQSGNRVLAGAFEAVLGAIYLDQGIRQTRTFLRRLLERDADEVISVRQTTNYKGRLQEILLRRDQVTPVYRTVTTSGPPHQRHFVVEVSHQGQPLGTGSGTSKRAAEQLAAREALGRLAPGEAGESDAGFL